MRNECDYCGSSQLRADRALSGRIVCMRCGRPTNGRSFTGKTLIRKPRKILKNYLFLIIVLFVFLIIIV